MIATTTTWAGVVQQAKDRLRALGLDNSYGERLHFEIQEIEKQGAESVWVNRVQDGKHFASNPNNLVIPWLLGMVADDPLAVRSDPILNTVRASEVAAYKIKHGAVPHDLVKDYDSPDIDIDCLPAARDPLKEYAIQQYGQDFGDGYGSVCSVGTWQTYKFKQALIDVSGATGQRELFKGNRGSKPGRPGADALTNNIKLLPDEIDELKDGGKATCQHKIKNAAGVEVDCGCVYAEAVCPKCGTEESDGPSIHRLLRDSPELREFDQNWTFPDKPRLVTTAAELIGRVRNMGMHAGAIIITDRPLYGNVPLARSSKKGYWVSMWTEGRNTQLSKFGYIKWDWLGLKTLKYIFNCCQLIEENRGISFGKCMSGWDDIDPSKRQAGHFFDEHNIKHKIDLDDPFALRLANEQKTDGVFQFDTDLAKSILSNGVRSFEDLLLFNAMGHPGPMQSIPEAVKNRDDDRGTWRKRLEDIHPILLEILGSTYGTLVWQEQLAAIWQRLGGFTSPEAQEARKAVAKKWVHKLRPIGEKWLTGAAPNIGRQNAEMLWEKMVTFGRYAFNLSHGVSYCLVAHRCLWLKAHFAPEFWASVMSDCHPDKLTRYMGVARAEAWEPTQITNCGSQKNHDGLRFGTINIDNLTVDFTVTGNTINQGLIGIKGIGDKAAAVFQGRSHYTDIDEFVLSAPKRQSKTVLQRFIQLGAFKHLPGHANTKALWEWYMYKYCKTGTKVCADGTKITMTKNRQNIRQQLALLEGWTDQAIKEERARQIAEWKQQYPKRSKIPAKFHNWKPKPHDTRERVMAFFPDDYTVAERLRFQLMYFGYWIDSPLDQYVCAGKYGIQEAKEAAKLGGEVRLEVIVTDTQVAVTRTGSTYLRVFITDGVQQGLLFVWSNELLHNTITDGDGVTLFADYDEKRGTFSLPRGGMVYKLKSK